MTDLHAIEVVTSWGDEVLDVVYVPPSRARGWATGTTTKNQVTREVRAVAPVEAIADVESTTDWWFWSVLAASTGFHGAFIVMLLFLPPQDGAGAATLTALPLGYTAHVEDPVETETPRARPSQTPDDRNGGTGTAHAAREGAMGAATAEATAHRYALADRRTAEPQLARAPGDSETRAAGVLGVLAATTANWNALSSPFGRELANGTDPENVIGALMGDTAGENLGAGGLGLHGVGRGGGGTGEGWIGLGDLGTIGHGAGKGGGNGFGYDGSADAANFRGRVGGAYGTLRICRGAGSGHGGCAFLVEGGLSREVIRRVIARHHAEVSYCYEQELAHHPELAGRVVVNFVIAPSGAVAAAMVKSSDIVSANVEDCVVNAVKRWSFPAPIGGGIVAVDYPFVFQSEGP